MGLMQDIMTTSLIDLFYVRPEYPCFAMLHLTASEPNTNKQSLE